MPGRKLINNFATVRDYNLESIIKKRADVRILHGNDSLVIPFEEIGRKFFKWGYNKQTNVWKSYPSQFENYPPFHLYAVLFYNPPKTINQEEDFIVGPFKPVRKKPVHLTSKFQRSLSALKRMAKKDGKTLNLTISKSEKLY